MFENRRIGLSRFMAIALLALIRVGGAAAAQVELSGGYDSAPGGVARRSEGDTWIGVRADQALVRETGGPLALTLDLSAGATAFSRLNELNQILVEARPGIDYVLAPRVDLALSLSAEGRLVRDDDQSAWGWGGSLRLRERLTDTLDISEYLSYRDLQARDAVYSGTTTAAGLALHAYLGERWTLGAGCEYARGDYLGSSTQDSGGAGKGQHLSAGTAQVVVREEENRLSGFVGIDHAWSKLLSSGLEYVVTRVTGGNGVEVLQAVTASTTLHF